MHQLLVTKPGWIITQSIKDPGENQEDDQQTDAMTFNILRSHSIQMGFLIGFLFGFISIKI